MDEIVKLMMTMNLPKRHRDELCAVLGQLCVIGHKIGWSPTDEVNVLMLLMEHMAEVRAA